MNYDPKTTTKEKYESIHLSDAEMEEALHIGRKEKYHKLKLEEYKLSLQREYLPVKMDAATLRGFIEREFPKFDPQCQPTQFDLLIDYFTGNEQKGLLLFGGVGCGKTTLMKLFQANPKGSYAVRSCRAISELFAQRDGGYDAIKPFFHLGYGMRNCFNHSEYGVCFDDLGEEKSKRFYGNESNVLEDILLARYEKRELWNKTHITTNLTAEQIEEAYGKRLRSRMREMFIPVNFEGVGDLRK